MEKSRKSSRPLFIVPARKIMVKFIGQFGPVMADRCAIENTIGMIPRVIDAMIIQHPPNYMDDPRFGDTTKRNYYRLLRKTS